MFSLLITCTFTFAACAPGPLQPTNLTSTEALVQALQQQGVAVARRGSMPRSAFPFFSVDSDLLGVQGDDVHVFEYRSAPEAERDSAAVSPTGTPIGQSQISWMDTPHFYKRDRLIVLYVGHTAEVLASLRAAMGPPFAGDQ
jgi:hypothetical protein